MKRVIFFILLFTIGMTTATFAQMKTHRKTTRQQMVKNKPGTTTNVQNGTQTKASDNTVSLTSTSANQAYAGSARRFSIADPTINILNERANGSNIPVGSSGIVGMPKSTYGFANGKILLRNTTAASSGTSYGSGAVATGTTITGIGTAENVIGVNGKNPYAGPWLWGSRPPIRPVTQKPSVSATTKQ